MSTDAKATREVKPLVAFRPGELAPLFNLWLGKNPSREITELVKESIRSNPEIRKLAGKRYAHLVNA